MKINHSFTLCLVAIIADFAFTSCASLPPIALRVEGNHGTCSINPNGVVVDIRSAK